MSELSLLSNKISRVAESMRWARIEIDELVNGGMKPNEIILCEVPSIN